MEIVWLRVKIKNVTGDTKSTCLKYARAGNKTTGRCNGTYLPKSQPKETRWPFVYSRSSSWRWCSLGRRPMIIGPTARRTCCSTVFQTDLRAHACNHYYRFVRLSMYGHLFGFIRPAGVRFWLDTKNALSFREFDSYMASENLTVLVSVVNTIKYVTRIVPNG